MSGHEAVLACPTCHRPNNRHANADPADQPCDGDVSICWACAAIGLFVGTPPTSIRQPTPQEHDEISNAPEIQRARNAITTSSNVRGALDQLRTSNP